MSQMDNPDLSSAVAKSFLSDVKAIRGALASELVCVLRYKRHYDMAEGINADPVKADDARDA